MGVKKGEDDSPAINNVYGAKRKSRSKFIGASSKMFEPQSSRRNARFEIFLEIFQRPVDEPLIILHEPMIGLFKSGLRDNLSRHESAYGRLLRPRRRPFKTSSIEP